MNKRLGFLERVSCSVVSFIFGSLQDAVRRIEKLVVQLLAVEDRVKKHSEFSARSQRVH